MEKVDKVEIRFLRQGLVSAKPPEHYKDMTPVEKIAWADTVLSGLDDAQIVGAMSDVYRPKGLKDLGTLFDEPPLACAIEVVREDNLTRDVATDEWHAFCSGRIISID